MTKSKERTLDEMPYDKAFGGELCHATGYEVYDEDTKEWWNEYVDSEGDFHYGR